MSSIINYIWEHIVGVTIAMGSIAVCVSIPLLYMLDHSFLGIKKRQIAGCIESQPYNTEDMDVHEGVMKVLEENASTTEVRKKTAFVKVNGAGLEVYWTKEHVQNHEIWKEKELNLVFYKMKKYLLSDCLINISPDGLKESLKWDSRFPIKIQTGTNGLKEAFKIYTKENIVFEEVPKTSNSLRNLLLFARTDREKQHWYRTLTAARKSPKNPQNSVKLSGVHILKPSAEYQTHLTTLVQGEPQNDALLWINKFMKRFFYDINTKTELTMLVRDKLIKSLKDLKLSIEYPRYYMKIKDVKVKFKNKYPEVLGFGDPYQNKLGMWYESQVQFLDGLSISLIPMVTADPDAEAVNQETVMTQQGGMVEDLFQLCEANIVVDLEELSGVLAINVPPPPTRSLWIGFHQPSTMLKLNGTVVMKDYDVPYLKFAADMVLDVVRDVFDRYAFIPNMIEVPIPSWKD